MTKKQTRCLACSVRVKPPLVAISHTIRPGASLCPTCGKRESFDALWAEGLRVGFVRDAAAREVVEPEGDE